MKLEINVPDDYMGDVMGDMNKRRGKILGMEPQAGGGSEAHGGSAQAELFDYAVVLRSMTQARGALQWNSRDMKGTCTDSSEDNSGASG